jgi:1-acyl-sn-glycerol-3-phosphate acyltransferase
VVLAETRETDETARDALRKKIRGLAVDLLDEPSVEVVLAPTHTVLKTSSGKIRRAACRQLWEEGSIGDTPRAAWLQLARLTARGWLFSARLQAIRAGEAAYAAWFWGSVSAGAAAFVVPVSVLPTRKLRWAATRASARLALRLAGVYPEVDGKEGLRTAEPVVFIANHSSYADNLVTAALMPDDVAVVAKRELEDKLFTRFVLRRLGVVFVERFQQEEGARGSNQLTRALAEGRSLLVYPEGTCLRMAGLLPFRAGAFQAAAEAGAPVVPLTIRGTRSLLRPTTWFPRRTPLRVKVGEPIRSRGKGWAAALALRDRARAAILAACGEPDLAGEDAMRHLERLRSAPPRGRKI